MNKILICTGDSYTAGTELCADELIPGYSTNLSHRYSKDPRPLKLQELNNKHVELRESLPSLEKQAYYDRCKVKAWPKKLGDLTGRTVINHSAGGRSNQHIVHTAIAEVENQLNFVNPEDIDVFCMITTSERYGYKNVENREIGHYSSFHPSHDLSVLKSMNRDYLKFVLLNNDSWDFLWSSYADILAAKTYLMSLGVRVNLLESSLWGWSLKQLAQTNKKDPRWGRHNKIKEILNVKINMDSAVVNDMCVLPGGHFIEEVHDSFAKLLFTKFYADENNEKR